MANKAAIRPVRSDILVSPGDAKRYGLKGPAALDGEIQRIGAGELCEQAGGIGASNPAAGDFDDDVARLEAESGQIGLIAAALDTIARQGPVGLDGLEIHLCQQALRLADRRRC